MASYGQQQKGNPAETMADDHRLDMDRPLIAVVGSQRTGKSSVLESIVGKEFLPKGTGLVTRRPVLIQIYPTTTDEYGIFRHRPNKQFFDFCKIRREILIKMTYVCTNVPIQLKLYLKGAPRLTLVDLPGVVDIEVGGDLPYVHDIRSIVLSYIRHDTSLMLAVTPAHQDLATSDALRIAFEVDPERTRTIGVLTKTDLLDEGTDACEILKNEQITLRRGYFAVLNRSQSDIAEGRDISYGLEKERIFFEEKECYRDWKHRCGTPNLQRAVLQHIQE